MKREILTVAAVLWATPAAATDTGHCDSKPFTLKKPAAAPKPAPVPAPTPALNPAAKPAAPAKPAKTASDGKRNYVPGCKQPKG